MSRRLAVVLAVILGAIAFLVVQGLGNATTFFRNADEAVAQRDSLGSKRFRLQGVVLPGSIDETSHGVDFVVEWNCATVPVTHAGTQPALLKDGIPVVLEGSFVEGSSTYDSDRVIIKHTEDYRTDESEKAEQSYEERCAKS
jgi:cytochrome c-type biogenesis protein CcmE